MTPMPMDARKDRLYALLPALYRLRDAEQGEPLRALLRVLAEQVNVLEDDIAQLYDNWFIETAQDWAVPYLAELIGYESVAEAGKPTLGPSALNRVLVPRREVANTLRARRRKGTLALLEDLARDVSGWPARAAEFYRLLSYCQSLNFLRQGRGRTVDVRDVERLERLNGPFDPFAHTVDVRRVQSEHSAGRYNIPSVGLFVWRLGVYSVTEAPATCLESVLPTAYTFSVLGNDAPLFARAVPETDPVGIADERNLPVPLRGRALEKELESYKLARQACLDRVGEARAACLDDLESTLLSYGDGRSFQIWRGVKQGRAVTRQAVPAEKLVVADLSDWHAYRPKRGSVALDPRLGRLLFPANQRPDGVWVSYHYGFSADLGGGEYSRSTGLAERPDAETFLCRISKKEPGIRSEGESWAASIEEALGRWQDVRAETPRAILELADSELYSEQLSITLQKGDRLTLRATDRTRPVIYLLDRERNKPDALTILSEGEQPGGCVTLDGLLIAGRAVHVEGGVERVDIRHCTLVPGWDLEGACQPKRPSEPSLELYQTTAHVRVERSILGSVRVYQDEVSADPLTLELADSILDATSSDIGAVYAPHDAFAHAVLSLEACTVFGAIKTHAVQLAENTLFMGRVRVARRQLGCMRCCYVPPGSRTPRRYRCQPDLVDEVARAAATWNALDEGEKARVLAPERLRLRPQFVSTRYGQPGYARLADTCAEEIGRGADDASEMGAFHHLFTPQRLANLQARLSEYSPARTDIAVILAD